MIESKQHSRDLALLALTMLSEMFSNSQINKKLEGDDQRNFDSLVALWTKGLDGLTRKQVEHGLDIVMEDGGTFEPSLPEFRKMCKPKRLHASHRAVTDNEVILDTERMLPPPSSEPPLKPSGQSHYVRQIQDRRIAKLEEKKRTSHEELILRRLYEARGIDADGQPVSCSTSLSSDIAVKRQLKKIGLVRGESESKHDFAMRCKAYLMANHSGYASLIGKKGAA